MFVHCYWYLSIYRHCWNMDNNFRNRKHSHTNTNTRFETIAHPLSFIVWSMILAFCRAIFYVISSIEYVLKPYLFFYTEWKWIMIYVNVNMWWLNENDNKVSKVYYNNNEFSSFSFLRKIIFVWCVKRTTKTYSINGKYSIFIQFAIDWLHRHFL